MSAALAELVELSRAGLLTGYVVFLRVGAIMALLPAFGQRMVPVRIRLVLALAFTLITAPAAGPLIDPALFQAPGRLLGTEIVIGLGLGAALRLFILALQITGSIAAQSVSLAQIFGGQSIDPQPAIGHVIVIAGLCLAVLSGLHVKVAQMIVFSYDLLPAGNFPDAGDFMSWGMARTAQAFALGFSLAAPFVITSLIYNVALGVINRAMPQLMVAFVGAPAITAGGLILLALSLPFVLQVWLQSMDSFIANPAGAGR